MKNPKEFENAAIVIRDVEGKLIEAIPIELNKEMNEVVYEHGYGMTGTFFYSLVINGEVFSTKKMVFAN